MSFGLLWFGRRWWAHCSMWEHCLHPLPGLPTWRRQHRNVTVGLQNSLLGASRLPNSEKPNFWHCLKALFPEENVAQDTKYITICFSPTGRDGLNSLPRSVGDVKNPWCHFLPTADWPAASPVQFCCVIGTHGYYLISQAFEKHNAKRAVYDETILLCSAALPCSNL